MLFDIYLLLLLMSLRFSTVKMIVIVSQCLPVPIESTLFFLIRSANGDFNIKYLQHITQNISSKLVASVLSVYCATISVFISMTYVCLIIYTVFLTPGHLWILHGSNQLHRYDDCDIIRSFVEICISKRCRWIFDSFRNARAKYQLKIIALAACSHHSFQIHAKVHFQHCYQL